MGTLIVSIMTTTPIDRDHAGDQLGKPLVEALAQRINVVGDARKDIARARALEIAHRHARGLLGNAAAQKIACLLRHARHEPPLHERAGRRKAVERKREQQDGGDRIEIDAARARDLGAYALEQFGRGGRKHLGADDVEHGRTDGEGEHGAQGEFERAHEREHLFHGPLEIGGLFAGHHAMRAVVAGHGTA